MHGTDRERVLGVKKSAHRWPMVGPSEGCLAKYRLIIMLDTRHTRSGGTTEAIQSKMCFPYRAKIKKMKTMMKTMIKRLALLSATVAFCRSVGSNARGIGSKSPSSSVLVLLLLPFHSGSV